MPLRLSSKSSIIIRSLGSLSIETGFSYNIPGTTGGSGGAVPGGTVGGTGSNALPLLDKSTGVSVSQSILSISFSSCSQSIITLSPVLISDLSFFISLFCASRSFLAVLSLGLDACLLSALSTNCFTVARALLCSSFLVFFETLASFTDLI